MPYLRSCGADLRASKVRDILGGPPFPDDETPRNNHSRNTLFEVVVAAKFWKAGQRPTLGKVADVEVSFNNSPYIIECKRPFSPARVEPLIEEAGAQLRKRLGESEEVARGVIALSFSKLRETPEIDEVDDEGDVVRILRADVTAEAERTKGVWGRWTKMSWRA